MKHIRRSRYDERKGEPGTVRGTSMSIIQEPLAVEIDLTSQGFKQNPFPTLTKMRELGPVIRVRFPLLGKVRMATTYDAINDLLRDHHRFVHSPAAAGNRGMGAIVRWLAGSLKPLASNLLLRDPPDHRRFRPPVTGRVE